MDPLVTKVSEALRRHKMATSETRLAVAVSGGADSICLLHVLAELHPRERLSVVHVNHHLRGEESDGDQAFVEETAVGFGVAVRVFHLALDPDQGNLEQSARDGRRRVFFELMEAGAVDRIALAHTLSDQAETVLFRFLRGAWTTGLAGMRPGDRLIRPLLQVTRAEVEAWLRDRGLNWREDSSNQDRGFARNRIRHDLLPQLEREWNPGLSQLLAAQARLAQDEEHYWDDVVRLPEGLGNPAIVDLDSLPGHPAVRRRMFREIIRHVKGDRNGVDFRHIEQILELANEADGHGRVQVPGVDVMRSFRQLRFAERMAGPVARNWSIPDVGAPGVFGLRTLEVEFVLELRDTLETEGLDWTRVSSCIEEAGSGSLVIRNWRPGDRYQPHGAGHEEKLKTMFHDARVPLWERKDWPILCIGDQILWSRRFGPAAAFASRSGTVLVVSERKRGL